MQVYPLPNTGRTALLAMLVIVVGLATQRSPLVGFGGAIILGVALARAGSFWSIARLRVAGLEMAWRTPQRVTFSVRGGKVELQSELRNRDVAAVRFHHLRALASPDLRITIAPTEGSIPAAGRLVVTATIETNRVGQHGIHGLALEVIGASGMFEAPLTFASPKGIEVIPAALARYIFRPYGGRARRFAQSSRSGYLAGDGAEFRELREHLPGDAFHRIAWKASARQSKLLVRTFDRDERDVVWIVIQPSAELFAGVVGRAAIDVILDEAATLSARHLSRGDHLGTVRVSTPSNEWIHPSGGVSHARSVSRWLATCARSYDAVSSALSESDVAGSVLEHVRFLDAQHAAGMRRSDTEKLAILARELMPRAPFSAQHVAGKGPHDEILRQYTANFGFGSHPVATDNAVEDARRLMQSLKELAAMKPSASAVYVAAKAPPSAVIDEVRILLASLRRHGISVRWMLPDVPAALREFAAAIAAQGESQTSAARMAIETTVQLEHAADEAKLKQLGVRMLYPRSSRGSHTGT